MCSANFVFLHYSLYIFISCIFITSLSKGGGYVGVHSEILNIRVSKVFEDDARARTFNSLFLYIRRVALWYQSS